MGNAADLAQIANALVAREKGILAADESSGTIKRRFDAINVENTEENRRDYRELLFRTEGAEKFVAGVILFDETLKQAGADGTPLVKVLQDRGVIPGIKVDAGVMISAPITEEIFFRGFLFGGTRRFTGALVAALITGFLFSMAHYNLGLIIPFTLIGVVLAMSYQRSGTLFVPIGAHFLFNLLSYTILVFVPEARP